MRDAALDFRANPELVNNCPKTLQHCKTVTKFDPNNGDDGGQVEGEIIPRLKNRISNLLLINETFFHSRMPQSTFPR